MKPRKREKNFSPKFRSYSTRERKFQKKIEKKIEKSKTLFPELFLAKTGVDTPKKREKKNFVPISVQTQPGEENSEKNSRKLKKLKTSFRHYFWPKRDEIGREREKKILLPYSVHSRPRQENSEKNSKKIEKI